MPEAPAKAGPEAGRESSPAPALVVGIGASAGGLKAYTQLLEHLPADTGMAYVLVQHLAPRHESMLAELLARHAAIPVTQVTEGQRVEPNHAYVIPPGASMILADGHLHLSPRSREERSPKPIDVFFFSLAEVNGPRAIGVVLSGTDSDGEQGVRAIKAAGGITFAQEPASAQYDSMPRSAIVTRCVDFVVSPAGIAEQLARIGRHPYVGKSEIWTPEPEANEEPDGEADAAPASPEAGEAQTLPREIFPLLRRRCGIDFSQYKQGTLMRRVRRRMMLTHFQTLTEYRELLERDPTEIDALCRDLFVSVTGFFRDPEAFKALATVGFPAMLGAQRPTGTTGTAAPVRVWVPGCATGEEAYSIAICLLEYLGDDGRSAPLQLFATDLSEAAIVTARAALYPASIEADVSPERLRRFFVKEERGYRVSEVVRNLCVFAMQNMTSDPPFSHLDLVSCRNVLIYLQLPLQAKVLGLFHYALAPTGVLFLGTAESVGPSPALFAPLDKKHRLYSPTQVPRRPPLLDAFRATGTPGASGPTPAPAPGGREPGLLELEHQADQIVLEQYNSAGVVIDHSLEIVQFRGTTGAYLAPAHGAASFQLLKMIRPELQARLHEAIRTARRQAAPARAEAVPFHEGGALRHVTLEVLPFKVVGSDQPFFVVLFEPEGPEGAGTAEGGGTGRRGTRRSGHVAPPDVRDVGELRQELAAMERHLRARADEHEAAVEGLQAASEEIESSNEELRSTNEELETAKEELQSANEELTTLNAELRDRNTDLSGVNDDLTNLLTSIQVPVLIVGRDLRIRRYTAGAERLVNLIPTDVGRPLGDLTLNVDVPDLVAVARDVMESLGTVEREVRDEAGCWYALRVRPYKTAAQKIDGAVMVFQNIDERKRHALALDEARRYAEAIVATVREPLVVLDGALRVERANRAFYAAFHVDPKETEGRTLFELGDGEWNLSPLKQLLEEVLPNESTVEDVEVEHTFPVIGHRLIRLNARELHMEHGVDDAGNRGHRRLILLAVEDVTDARRLVERTRFLADTGVGFGASVDPDAVLEKITRLAVPALADWCLVDLVDAENAAGEVHRAAVGGPDGADAERMRQMAMAAALTPDDPVRRVLETGEPLRMEAVPAALMEGLVSPDGDPVRHPALTPRSLVIVPLTAGGRVLGALTLVATGAERRFISADIALAEEFARRAALALENATLYREAEAARAAAEKANLGKTEFLATMSHELRTPLNAILGYAQLLHMDIHGALTEAQRQDVLRIEAGQRHLNALIDDILQFAKLEAGHAALHIADIAVEAMLTEIDALIVPAMRRQGIHYETRPCAPTITLRGDQGRVRQIMLNLLANAVKFTDTGGRVVLECEAGDADVRLRVTDTGIGIAPDKLDLIFDPFIQLETTLTRRADGTGLGLAISRDLARGMGGDLEVRSVVGEGSAFTLRLPRGEAR